MKFVIARNLHLSKFKGSCQALDHTVSCLCHFGGGYNLHKK